MAEPSNTKLAIVLAESFPQDHIQIREGQWFVVGVGTAREISDKLRVTPGLDTGPAVIGAVSGYYSRPGSQVWEWVAAKVGKPTSA